MGNRAVITTPEKRIGVYLHWNGGRDSVEAFLTYCRLKGYRDPAEDCYGWAYLCQVITNYFGDGLSVGIDRYENLDRDNGDNGVYVVKDWRIVKRIYAPSNEQREYNLLEMLLYIDENQPENHHLGEEAIRAGLEELDQPF